MSPAAVARGESKLPAGVTCPDCASVGWPDCGTARDIYCVADDRGPFEEPDQDLLTLLADGAES